MSRTNFLGTGLMGFFDRELWLIGLALNVAIKKRYSLHEYEVKTVAVLSNSQAAIQQVTNLVPGPGQ